MEDHLKLSGLIGGTFAAQPEDHPFGKSTAPFTVFRSYGIADKLASALSHSYLQSGPRFTV
jgi:hypothetical protein